MRVEFHIETADDADDAAEMLRYLAVRRRERARVAKAQAAAGRTRHADAAMMLGELNLMSRTINALRAEGIVTVGDVLERTKLSLLRVPNVGRGALEELQEKLAARGISWS